MIYVYIDVTYHVLLSYIISCCCVDEVGKKLAMHIVAANPTFLSIKDVPIEVVQKETDIFRQA